MDLFQGLREKLGTGEGSSGAGTSGLEDLLEKIEEEVGPTFEDVPDNAWFTSYVTALAKWKIVEGYKDEKGEKTGRFGPGDPVTVAQFLKMTLRAGKVDEKRCTGTPRHPNATNHWAYLYVVCAEEMALRLFEELPDLERPILRGEALGLLHDAFRDPVPPFESPFTDTAGHPYAADIAYANFRGVVNGDTDAHGDPLWRFRPDDGMKRAEAVKMLYEQLRAIVTAEKDGDVVTIDVISRNHSFTPSTITVRKGQVVTLRFRNTGKHTFTAPGLLISKLLLEPREEFSFFAETVGTYLFQCAVEGHKEKGMEGMIVIKPKE